MTGSAVDSLIGGESSLDRSGLGCRSQRGADQFNRGLVQRLQSLQAANDFDHGFRRVGARGVLITHARPVRSEYRIEKLISRIYERELPDRDRPAVRDVIPDWLQLLKVDDQALAVAQVMELRQLRPFVRHNLLEVGEIQAVQTRIDDVELYVGRKGFNPPPSDCNGEHRFESPTEADLDSCETHEGVAARPFDLRQIRNHRGKRITSGHGPSPSLPRRPDRGAVGWLRETVGPAGSMPAASAYLHPL